MRLPYHSVYLSVLDFSQNDENSEGLKPSQPHNFSNIGLQIVSETDATSYLLKCKVVEIEIQAFCLNIHEIFFNQEMNEMIANLRCKTKIDKLSQKDIYKEQERGKDGTSYLELVCFSFH